MREQAVVVRVRALPAPRGIETDEERQLVALAQSGDEQAKHVILERYEPLVERWVKHYSQRGTLTKQDVHQEGRAALLQSIRRYDPSKKASFFTFAYYRVHGDINLLICRYSRPLQIPREHIAVLRELIELETQWLREGRDFRHEDFARELGITTEDVSSLLAVRHQRSYDTQETEAVGERWQVASDENTERHVVEDLDRRERIYTIRMVLARLVPDLPEQQRFVLLHYYGFGGERAKNLAEIASLMGVGQSRVSQIHRKALSALAPELACVVGSPGARTSG